MGFEIQAIRRYFPYLDRCIYLNTASAGLSWTGQGAAAARFYDTDKAQGYDGREGWRAQRLKCQQLLAQLVNVQPDQISFVSSTSEALSLVARAVPLAPADEVVLAADEFPSVVLAWTAHTAAGGEVRRVPIRSEAERTAALIDAISARTRVVCASHVHWCTGTKIDLDALGQACRRQGARLIVDGVQAVGATPIDAAHADFYAASVFKWLLSGFGLAFISMKRDFAATLEPGLRGHGNEGDSQELRYGHANHPGLYALAATLEFLQGIGWPAIHARVDSLAQRLDEELRRAEYCVITPPTARAGIVSIELANAAQCTERLHTRGVRVESRAGLIRISPHFYNTGAEVERFVDILSLDRAGR
jgi:selenocysteine lyase/cysteine desulfurase